MLFVFPRGVLGEILNLIESVSEGFPSYFFIHIGATQPNSVRGNILLLENINKDTFYRKNNVKEMTNKVSLSKKISLIH